MKRNFGTFTLLVAILMAALGCDRATQQMTPIAPADDEESTVQLALTDTYDNIRNGAHLIMAYDPASKSFKGTVTNTTDAILPQVRVEIHLSKGGVTTAELGPTTPKDLTPGETQDIVLMEEGPPFDMWTAHPEVGASSSGGEGGGEHAGGAEVGGEGGAEGAGEAGGEGGGEHAGGAEAGGN